LIHFYKRIKPSTSIMEGNMYQGMTIHNLLEKVDLLNFMFDEDSDGNTKTKESSPELSKTISVSSDPTSAYLGPRNLWSNPITLDDLMDDDSSGGEMVNMNDVFETASASSSPPRCEEKLSLSLRPPIIVPVKKECVKLEPNLQKGGNDFLYVESKRARLEREKEERKRKFEVELDFAPEDIALATVPGLDFDPKTRNFDMEELRPQPIIKKRKKNAVPDEMKDERYWEKRQKNKEATRRSREAKRLKENQIVLRAAYLEKENKVLKQELETTNFEKSKLETEIDILKRKLGKYEPTF